MAEDLKSIDISGTPELLRLAEEVARLHESRILQRDGEALAVVMPITQSKKARRRGRAKTEADYEAFRRAAGSWKGLVDTDKLIEDIYESRRTSSRPPIDL